MKKLLIILALSFAMNEAIQAQSITLKPSTNLNTEVSIIKKIGMGFSHESPNGLVKLGTWVDNNNAFIQTHTNNPLYFSTNNGGTQMQLLTNGNFGIGSFPISPFEPTAKFHVNGYTKLGIDAPAIKIVKFAGITALTQGGNQPIVHGLTASKILSISVVVDLGPAGNVFENYTQSAGYQVGVSFDNNYIYVWNSPANSANILSKFFKVLVTYEE